MNPYSESNFFTFFSVLLNRIGLFLMGDLTFNDLSSDEIQLIVIGLESIVCAVLGVWLSLRKITMLANALSHTILLGIVLVYLLFRTLTPEATNGTFHIPLLYLMLAAIGTGIITTYLVSYLTISGKVYEDASIGLVFTSMFALGILLVNIATRSAHVGIEAVMGNPDGLIPSDILEIIPIFIVTLTLIILFHRDLLLTTFDSVFARVLGTPSTLIHYGLMVLVSFALIGGFRAVGVIMVLAFMACPPLLVRPFVKSLKSYLLASALVALFFSIIGVVLARHLLEIHGFALSTGGLIVTLLACSTLVVVAGKRLVDRLNTRRLKQGS